MNNMQQVSNWTLFDVVPIIYTAPAVNLDVPSTFQIETGPNGWSWELKQGGAIVGNQSALYGQLASQFSQLAAVW